MANNDSTSDKKIKSFVQTNIPWLLGILLTILNLYITTLISPLKQDIFALAESVDDVQMEINALQQSGTVNSQLNSLRVDKIEGNIVEIKQTLIRIEDKMDR